MPIPLPVIANTYRVTLNWQLSGVQHAANVIHLQRAAGTAVDVFNDLAAHVTQPMWYPVSTSALITTVDIIKLDGTSGRITFSTDLTAKWSGNGGTGDAIIAASALVKLGTGLRGRANRGRIYLPFVAELGQANGAVTAAFVAAWQPAWNTFLAAMTALPTPLVVASYARRTGGVGAHATLVNVVSCETELGTQRKRQSRLR